MSKSAILEELDALTVSIGVAGEGASNSDWMKVELALIEVQDRTGRLLREIGIIRTADDPELSPSDE